MHTTSHRLAEIESSSTAMSKMARIVFWMCVTALSVTLSLNDLERTRTVPRATKKPQPDAYSMDIEVAYTYLGIHRQSLRGGVCWRW